MWELPIQLFSAPASVCLSVPIWPQLTWASGESGAATDTLNAHNDLVNPFSYCDIICT